MTKKILITGKPGIGKTTVIKKLANILNDKAVGFYTEEYRDPKTHKRKGFKVITTFGKQTILADVDLKSPYKVGKYGVNVEGFEKTVIPLLTNANKEREKIFLIDEIGKMEFYSEKFRDLIEDIMENPDIKVVATISKKDFHPLIKKIKNLPDVKLIEINYENRDRIVQEILKMLNESKN